MVLAVSVDVSVVVEVAGVMVSAVSDDILVDNVVVVVLVEVWEVVVVLVGVVVEVWVIVVVVVSVLGLSLVVRLVLVVVVVVVVVLCCVVVVVVVVVLVVVTVVVVVRSGLYGQCKQPLQNQCSQAYCQPPGMLWQTSG